MNRLAGLAGRADVRAVDRAGTTADHLRRREVVVRRWRRRRNSIRVEAEDVERGNVVVRDESGDVRRDPRIHDADITGKRTAVETRLFPVTRLIAVSAAVSCATWAAVGKSQLRGARSEIELQRIGGAADRHNACAAGE